MGKIKGFPKKFYCQICKTYFKDSKEFKKHVYKHYDKIRCPFCRMPTGNLSTHLTLYHIKPNRSRLLHRDLAILVKEAGTMKILKELNIKLSDGEKDYIRNLSRML
jgi:hypothetical protein